MSSLYTLINRIITWNFGKQCGIIRVVKPNDNQAVPMCEFDSSSLKLPPSPYKMFRTMLPVLLLLQHNKYFNFLQWQQCNIYDSQWKKIHWKIHYMNLGLLVYQGTMGGHLLFPKFSSPLVFFYPYPCILNMFSFPSFMLLAFL